jgi:phage shock protein PspC (stress-responsive transcriptional regulator)
MVRDIMTDLKGIIEKSAFGVCSFVGERIGVSVSNVRLYFIYLSFVGLGSPIIIYLFMLFWLNIKRYVKNSRNLIWQ